MHILIIPSWYPDSDSSIRGSFFREQALALFNSGKEIGVIYPNFHSLRYLLKGNQTWHRGIEIENDCGVLTYRWHEWAVSSRIPYLYEFNFLKTGVQLFQLYTKKHGLPDIIHAHSAFMGGSLASEIKKNYNIPYLLTEHSSGIGRGIIYPWQRKKVERAFKESDALVVVSPNLGEDLKINFKKSVSSYQYIPNIVNIKLLEESQEKQKIDCFTFLNISAMINRKRQKDILIAFAKNFAGNENVKLKIAGDGFLRKKLERMTFDLGIVSQVSFLGQIERKKIFSIIKSCNVLVHASEYETFGVVLIEALACGLPVISTECGGAECIVNGMNGVLVPVGNIEAIGTAMQTMYNNYSNYDLKKISQDCLSRFAPDVVARKLSIIYEKILNS